MLVAANQMKVSVNRLLADPEFYLFNYQAREGTSEFLIVNEELLGRAPFVDIRLAPFARGQFTISTADLTDLVGNEPGTRPRQHFIFHHAFVCSTLLARCLAESDAFFSLKEPQILRQLSDLKRESGANGELPRGWGRVLKTHLQLLAKNYSHGNQVVIKASNVSNNLVEDVIDHSPDSQLIYLHSSLPEFLVANLKKPGETRRKIPDLLARVAAYSDFLETCPQFRELGRASFLETCGLLWLASHYNFLHHCRAADNGRVRTLAMRDFLAEPAAVLTRVCRFFGHDPSPAELRRMTDDAILARHSKDPNQKYDEHTRSVENARVYRQHAAEISAVVSRLDPVTRELDIPARLEGMAL
ncbi:hypothetical protein [Elongatibacter sediminis]|uniref:Uncharacterized protein n=1 Tax=Elongatibacter sediminis TaxID=3119006 RepID=A0AAW9REK7_9GAMM